VEDLPHVLRLQRLQLRQQQQQLRVEKPVGGTGGPAQSWWPSPWQRDPGHASTPQRVPALGHGVPVVDVALERQGHLLLECINEVPLGDAGVVWGCRAGISGAEGTPRHGGPLVPTWREEPHGLEQDVLGLVQLQLLQADVELEQRLQVDLLKAGCGERGGDGQAGTGTWLSPAPWCHCPPSHPGLHPGWCSSAARTPRPWSLR